MLASIGHEERKPGRTERNQSVSALIPVAAVVLAIAMGLLFGCSEDVYLGELGPNTPPRVTLTNGPVEGDTVSYQVALSAGDPIGFDPADTTGLDKWTKIYSNDTLLVVEASEFDTNVTINLALYGLYDETHTFFLRAVDNRGKRSEAASRSFTAFTLAPTVLITYPKNPSPGSGQFLANRVTFIWKGKDPIDSPWNYQDVESVRYFCKQYYGYSVADMNKNPENFESWWSPWIATDAPGDSGITTIMGDDEFLQIGRDYLFAVQAKDDAGAITSIFSEYNNARHFFVLEPTGPLITYYEPILGSGSFIGTNFRPDVYAVPAGFPLNFNWTGDASTYGGVVKSYRYGWDVADVNDPAEWDCSASPYVKAAPTTKFYSGIHTLFIESVDDYGAVTIAQIEIEVISAAMDRNLLWVDDFYSTNFIQSNYAMPTESQHDQFWTDLCLRAEGFDPDVDIFDTTVQSYIPNPPDVRRVMRYKNIIWTISSEAEVCAWNNLIVFHPEGDPEAESNLLLFYLSAGGHLWTSGRQDKLGGLAAVGPYGMAFPCNLRCEIWGPTLGCADTSGVTSFAYRDYCVTALDKVWAEFRRDVIMTRSLERDALSWTYKDPSNAITSKYPQLPDSLGLWDVVAESGNFFDPDVRGLYYVEVYNPAYWMNYTKAKTQACFNPMYRMRARYQFSPLNYQVIAFWFTKYAHIVPEAEGAIGAPSVHFGIPLWFFDHEAVKTIADVIFTEWQINMY
jgi:hypothetical protein